MIDLKMGKLKPENVGQINMYLNYYNTEVNDKDDNQPIGIILCADKDEIAAEYDFNLVRVDREDKHISVKVIGIRES